MTSGGVILVASVEVDGYAVSAHRDSDTRVRIVIKSLYEECIGSGFISWDGSLRLDFDPEFKLFGPGAIADLAEALRAAFKLAQELMPGEAEFRT